MIPRLSGGWRNQADCDVSYGLLELFLRKRHSGDFKFRNELHRINASMLLRACGTR